MMIIKLYVKRVFGITCRVCLIPLLALVYGVPALVNFTWQILKMIAVATYNAIVLGRQTNVEWELPGWREAIETGESEAAKIQAEFEAKINACKQMNKNAILEPDENPKH